MKAMKDIWKIVQREFKYILRNKRILVIMCLVPLILTLIFGAVYNEKTIKNMKLGVINYSESQASRELISNFEKTETFSEVRYLADEEEIQDLLKKGEIQGAMIIPEDFTEKVKKGEEAVVMIGADGSNMSISNTILTKASEITSNTKIGGSFDGTPDTGDAAAPITYSIRNWFNPGVNYSDFLLLGYVAAIIQQVLMYFAAISITEEERWGTMRELKDMNVPVIGIILGKMIPYVALGMLSWLASLVIVFGFFRTPMRGSWGIMILLSLVFLFFIASISLFISTMARRSIDATQYAMVVALPSFLLCGYTWPMVAMTGIYKIIGHLFPITYFAVNVRNIALMDAGIQQIAPDMAVMIVLSIIFIQLSNLRGTLLFGALYPQGKLN